MARLINKFVSDFSNKWLKNKNYKNDEISLNDYKEIQKTINYYYGGNKFSLNCEFSDTLDKLYNEITDEQFIDFRTRFTYFKIKDNKVLKSEIFSSKLVQFTRGGKDYFEEIGIVDNNEIILNDKMKMIKVGSLYAYHYYNVPFWLACIPTEIICQLNKELLNSDKEYYFNYELDKDDYLRFGCHYIKWNFYEIC